MRNFDEYTKMEDFQGKAHADLPYNLRVELFQKLLPEDRKQFELGRSTPEILKQTQEVYDNWFEQQHPTDEILFERMQQSNKRSDIENIERKIKRNQAELDRLTELKRLDGQIAIGERERLRKEIDKSKKILQTLAGQEENIEGNTTDWVDNFFKD